MILALDTTHEYGSLALVDRDAVLEERLVHSPEGFGHVIFDEISLLLDRHGCTLEAIDCFAAASGPGSFTGVRIGLACIKGLAEATAKPAMGISNLQALARFGTHSLRAVVLDARREEIYGAVYDATGRLVCPEVVTKFSAWLETLPDGVEFVSADFSPWRAALERTRFAAAPVTTAPRALAAAVAGIAEARLRDGAEADPEALDANYVRRSDAELLWKQ